MHAMKLLNFTSSYCICTQTFTPFGRSQENGQLAYLRPDGKTQVTVEYIDGKPVRIDTIVISTQHAPDITQKAIREDMIEHVIKAVLPAQFIDENTKYLINPTGRFVIGGPQGDAGLTGRKLLLILTAEWLAMAAVPSPEKIRQKWIAQQHMLRVMWQRISWQQVLRINVKFNWLMQLV